jgi:hypothetical protein
MVEGERRPLGPGIKGIELGRGFQGPAQASGGIQGHVPGHADAVTQIAQALGRTALGPAGFARGQQGQGSSQGLVKACGPQGIALQQDWVMVADPFEGP